MVLNELQPGITFEADEQTNAFNQVSYTVKIEVSLEWSSVFSTVSSVNMKLTQSCLVDFRLTGIVTLVRDPPKLQPKQLLQSWQLKVSF